MVLRKFMALIFVWVILAGVIGAQTTTTPTGSNVVISVVLCSDRAVVNLSGHMLAGYDLFFQAYSGAQGTGGAVTPLRQAKVDGDYSFSEIVPYNEGVTFPAGHIGSVYVAIARETDSTSIAYKEFVDDIQDGCSEPQFNQSSSTALNGTTPTTTGDETVQAVPAEGATQIPTGFVAVQPSATDPLRPIFSPFGGYVNPGYVPVNALAGYAWTPPRQETPGLIFVECNQYRMAEPGTVYDTDNVTLFWSWYAKTSAQVQDHIDNAIYSVTFFDEPALPVPNVVRSEIEYRSGDYWVFYYAQLGHLRPSSYGISYNLWWKNPITDGYDDFGPGTDNELLHGDCSFDIRRNLDNTTVNYTYWPPIELKPLD